MAAERLAKSEILAVQLALPPTPTHGNWTRHPGVIGQVPKRALRARTVEFLMLIHTAEGKRSIDDDLVLCIDRHRGESERCAVTLYLLSGEQVTGVAETAIREDDY
jgi:hypothetical protein